MRRRSSWVAVTALLVAMGTGCGANGPSPEEQVSTTTAPLATVFASQVAGGAFHTCILLTDHTVQCGGDNFLGELGDGTRTAHLTPAPVPGLSNVQQIAVGSGHSCALLFDKTVKCWGDDVNGEIGDGATGVFRFTPVAVVGLANVTAISSSHQHTCAVLTDGTVKCWGANTTGQLGDGTLTDRSVPTIVPGLSGAIGVAAGLNHSCALLGDRTVKCWGQNTHGEVGDGTTALRLTPTTVGGLSGVFGIAAGFGVSCGILSGGKVKCWGLGGLVGDGTNVARLTPTSVVGLTGVIDLSAKSKVCAMQLNGTVTCWGFAQTSIGEVTDHFTPTPLPCLGGVSQTGQGDEHFCAVHTDGAVSCWGRNEVGQLADGTMTNRPIPEILPSFPGNGTGTSASCCSAHPGVGCNRPAVVSCVCAASADPFCCTSSWDLQCRNEGSASTCWSAVCGNGVVEAGETCDDGNMIPGDGCDVNCRREGFACVIHGTPDISDATTSACVCAIDSFCCNSSWDFHCAGEANTQCHACGSPCTVHETPGSTEPNVTTCVCAIDNFCCRERWDGICVSEASNNCARACP
jgi:cysteine-rich repeat protein